MEGVACCTEAFLRPALRWFFCIFMFPGSHTLTYLSLTSQPPQPAQAASQFPPVSLGSSPSLLYDGRLITVMGWGRTEDGSPATVLHDVNLLYVPSTTCNNQQMWNGNILPSMFCAGGGVFDSCDVSSQLVVLCLSYYRIFGCELASRPSSSQPLSFLSLPPPRATLVAPPSSTAARLLPTCRWGL